MADQYYWLGSVGPFKYDDASPVNDAGLLFDGVAAPNQAQVITTGQLNVATAPVADGNVLRWDDLDSGLVGDVSGPAGATDNAVARFDGATGKLLQDSVVLVDNTGNVTGVVDLTASGDVKLATGKALIVNSIQVVSDQQAAEPDVAAVSAVTVTAGAQTIDITATDATLATMVTEINAIKTKLNNLLAKVRTHGLIA